MDGTTPTIWRQRRHASLCTLKFKVDVQSAQEDNDMGAIAKKKLQGRFRIIHVSVE